MHENQHTPTISNFCSVSKVYLSQFCGVIRSVKFYTLGVCNFSETYGIPHKRNR